MPSISHCSAFALQYLRLQIDLCTQYFRYQPRLNRGICRLREDDRHTIPSEWRQAGRQIKMARQLIGRLAQRRPGISGPNEC